MEKLNLCMIAFPGAEPEIFAKGKQQLWDAGLADIVHHGGEAPDLLLVLTGGSEHESVGLLKKSRGIAILAGDKDNSFAAAMEIKAWCHQHQIPSLLFNLNERELKAKLIAFLQAKKALINIDGSSLGVLGKPSRWLISSGVNADRLKAVFGIDLIQIPWDRQDTFRNVLPDESFLQKFGRKYNEAARVYTLINNTIDEKKLDAITVECFPLVNQENVTACLALSMLNDRGIVAGCEADVTAAVGMIMARTLGAAASWMANVASIDSEAESVLLAHCTIATRLVDVFSVTTHYESGKGTAIQGEFKGDLVTIFRIDCTLSKAFITIGKILSRPTSPHACRTQIEVKLPVSDLKDLKERPLGNHHIVIPGDWVTPLKHLCQLINIELLK
jgi:L-fucose isomerase-like protein